MNDASEPVRRTGVIGLGARGSAFARHMVDKGFAVAGYDVDVDAMRRAADCGVASCLAPGEVGNNAEVVIVMVATDDQVELVMQMMPPPRSRSSRSERSITSSTWSSVATMTMTTSALLPTSPGARQLATPRSAARRMASTSTS